MSITEKNRFQQWRRNWTSRMRAYRRDRFNKAWLGTDAPRYAELIWVPLDELKLAVKAGNSKASAKVVTNWPDAPPQNIEDLKSIRACLQHWRDGLSWEETGIFDVMMAAIREHGSMDRLRTLDDVQRRYRQLDTLYQRIYVEGGLSPRKALIPGNYREEGGILIHIGPDGTPFFGKKGHHRLAMALAAGASHVPAQLGVIHLDGLSALPDYRATPISP